MDSLPDDATISSILTKLNNPEEYLRGVLQNMHVCKNRFGAAFVRIGTMGRGKAPHYRVQPNISLEEESSANEFNKNWDADYVAYHGRNHKQLDWGFGEIRDEHWSENVMSYSEVQELLGSLRGVRRA